MKLLMQFTIMSLLLTTSAYAQNTKPIDVFGSPIDSRAISRYLEKAGAKLVEDSQEDTFKKLQEQLGSLEQLKTPKLDSLTTAGLSKTSEVYRHMVKSNVVIGRLYDCGNCDRTHVSCAGGVIVSESGLMLTNHHVLHHDDGESGNESLGFLAMTYDGKCFGIDKVLAADEESDVALVQLKADGHRFFASPIAKRRADPTTHIRILSHPSGQFFVLSEGEVSRYSATPSRDGKNADQFWMEITAEFGFGSSGSGVFNAKGEIVGLVSRVFPLRQSYQGRPGMQSKQSSKPKLSDMIIRRCVPLKRIHQCFGNEGAAEKSKETGPGDEGKSDSADVDQGNLKGEDGAVDLRSN